MRYACGAICPAGRERNSYHIAREQSECISHLRSKYIARRQPYTAGRIYMKEMIIIITGASHTGKTLLAQRMLEKYKYPYLSIDHLKMGLIRSGNTDLTPEDDNELTEYLWPIVREIMKTAIENRQNLIIEGCYIPFEWRRDFNDKYLQNIRFICLAMSERYIENHFDEIIGYESEIEARMIDADCTIDGLIEDNRSTVDGFQNAGEQVVRIDSDYEQTIKALLG